MKLRFRMIVTGILAVSSTLGLNGQALSPAPHVNEQQAAEDALDHWVQDNYGSVLDTVFRNSCDVPKSSGEMIWTMCVRIVPSASGDPEFMLLVGNGYKGKSFARIIRPKGPAVYTQLGNQKREHPTAASSDLIKFIHMETKEGNEKEIPALMRIVEEFEQLSFSPVLPAILYIDPTVYHFSIESLSGYKMEIELEGPGSYEARQPHPLLTWVEETRRLLNASFK